MQHGSDKLSATEDFNKAKNIYYGVCSPEDGGI